MNTIISALQTTLNTFIRSEEVRLEDALFVRLSFLNDQQQQKVLQKDIEETVQKIASLLLECSILYSIIDLTNNENFLWESSFFESIQPEQRRKYFNFSNTSIDYQTYRSNNLIYDDIIPYFSQIVKFVSLEKYIKHLKVLDTKMNKDTISKILPEDNKKNKESEILSSHITLQSNLSEEQIDCIVKCINTLCLFTEVITNEKFKQILACQLDKPLRLNQNKNKLLVYLFCELDYKNYITNQWQSIASRCKLFCSYNGNPLEQNNFSSTVYQMKERPPKDSHIIDNYIKEVRTH